MLRYRKHLVLLSLASILFLFGSYNTPPKGKPVFGVCISNNATGSFYTFIAYLKTDYGTKVAQRTLLKKDLIKFASGYWPSVYNPQRDDLFSEHDLYCGVQFDSSVWEEYPMCSPMDSLWKIRFRGYPFQDGSAAGWANNDFRPSTNQAQYLYKEFGIRNIDHDFFVDTNFWKLLQCVSDKNWIDRYRGLN